MTAAEDRSVSTALVSVDDRGVVRFRGGPGAYHATCMGVPLPAVAYRVPRDTLDPRYSACTDHHVACDCREAEQAEQLHEHQAEWSYLRQQARRALAGHQLHAPRDWWTRYRVQEYPYLCLCGGCRLARAYSPLLRYGDVDNVTGRVLPPEDPRPTPQWAPEDVPF